MIINSSFNSNFLENTNRFGSTNNSTNIYRANDKNDIFEKSGKQQNIAFSGKNIIKTVQKVLEKGAEILKSSEKSLNKAEQKLKTTPFITAQEKNPKYLANTQKILDQAARDGVHVDKGSNTQGGLTWTQQQQLTDGYDKKLAEGKIPKTEVDKRKSDISYGSNNHNSNDDMSNNIDFESDLNNTKNDDIHSIEDIDVDSLAGITDANELDEHSGNFFPDIIGGLDDLDINDSL